MKFRMVAPTPQTALAASWRHNLTFRRCLAQCLLTAASAQPEAIRAFLQPRLRQLADPFRCEHGKAVDRLFPRTGPRRTARHLWRLRRGRRDSTTLLVEVLGALGWKTNFYLPTAWDEGYGLSRTAWRIALTNFSNQAVLAVDCGSTAVGTINWLHETRRGCDRAGSPSDFFAAPERWRS